jgi:hypothetical protein
VDGRVHGPTQSERGLPIAHNQGRGPLFSRDVWRDSEPNGGGSTLMFT